MKLGELFNSQTPTDRLEGWGKTGRNVKRCETHLCSLILSCQDCTSSPKPPVVTDMPYLESPKHLQLPAFSKGMPSPGSPSPTGSQFQECDAEMGSLPGTVSEDMFKAAANSLCRQQGFECLCFFTACNLDILYANIYIYIYYIYTYKYMQSAQFRAVLSLYDSIFLVPSHTPLAQTPKPQLCKSLYARYMKHCERL